MVKPSTTSTANITKPSTSAETPKEGASKDPSMGSPETPAETQAEKGGKKGGKEKRHPYTVQLSPVTWRRAKLLASLSGTTVSRFVEEDLNKRVAANLKALLENLDKTEGE